MRRMGRWAVAFLAAAVFAAVPASAPAAGRPGYETYVVRQGDTLAGIAKKVFGDASRWREILKENPQVTNANRIYPGDSLLVPVPLAASTPGLVAVPAGGFVSEPTAADEAAEAAQAAAEAAAKAAAEAAAKVAAEEAARAAAEAAAAVPELPIQPVRQVARVSPGTYRSAGYIADGLPAIAIVATVDNREILGTGDVAIANAPVAPGKRYTVVRADRRVFHPKTGAALGWLVRVLGNAECTCRGEVTSTVALIGMRDGAGPGDYLVPFDPGDVLEEDVLPPRLLPECVSPGPEDGVIVAFDEDRLLRGEQDLAYIDRGTSSGVLPGRRFVIYRDSEPEGRQMLGELQVLRAGPTTATALVTTSIQELEVGDLLRAR